MTDVLQTIPLERLHPSPRNPRQHYDAQALEELAASLRQSGVLTPLIVRPWPGGSPLLVDGRAPAPGAHYEIGAGHRRRRAAEQAGLAALPAIVRDLDDAAFLELLTVENVQRQDVHPLDEAEGYRTLMAELGYDVPAIAAKIGKSVKYVYDRLKLLALTADARTLFLAGVITAGHAILLARLTPADQARVLDAETGGLFREERLLWDPEDDSAGEEARTPVSVRELQAWIDEHVKLDPATVDPQLFPAAADALAAQREQGERLVAITYEDFVARDARSGPTPLGPRSWKRADDSPGNKRCDFAISGVVLIGPHRGEVFDVCLEKKKCAVHWAEEQRYAKQRAAAATRPDSPAAKRLEADARKRQDQRARADAEDARWEKAAPKILEALAAAVKKAPARATSPLGRLVLEHTEDPWGPMAKGLRPPATDSAEDLVRHLGLRALANEFNDQGAAAFAKLAKATAGVDLRPIVDAVAPPPGKVQTAAPAPATKKGRRTAPKKKAPAPKKARR
jgi:ParB family chromosome partitioning protein